MKPYYEDTAAGITIYHGRCEDVLPTLGAVDLVLTDPPYGISDAPITYQDAIAGIPAVSQVRGRQGSRIGHVNTWHPASDWDEAIDPAWCVAVCAVAPVVAWFGHWRKREEVAAAMSYPLRAEIVWAKDMHVGPPCPVAMRDERIWLFSDAGIKGRTFETSVWDVPIIPTWAYKHHKNEKPIALIKRLVCFLTDVDMTILDPFMGSGTTLVAAKSLGRKAIGIDVSESYCLMAAQRLAQQVMDL